MTGCDRAAGDVARRALADHDRLPKVEAWFRRTAGERGYAKDVLDEVWETVSSFGAYGFCRAHAVAFAVPALQSAYLKAHFPAYLYAGLLEHDPGMWPRRVIVADARRHGVAVLPVDVDHSRGQHSVERAGQGWGVRLALSTVKGISEAAPVGSGTGRRASLRTSVFPSPPAEPAVRVGPATGSPRVLPSDQPWLAADSMVHGVGILAPR
jgi:error-prone DNA polymerase